MAHQIQFIRWKIIDSFGIIYALLAKLCFSLFDVSQNINIKYLEMVLIKYTKFKRKILILNIYQLRIN